MSTASLVFESLPAGDPSTAGPNALSSPFLFAANRWPTEGVLSSGMMS